MTLKFVWIGAFTLILSAQTAGAMTPTSVQPVQVAPVRRLWDSAMAMPGIDTGPATSAKRMVIFFDPNCPMCARQWRFLEPYLGQLRIHWVPIAYFHPSSLNLAAAILAAKDPAHALAFNEEHYIHKTETGGYLAPLNVPGWAIQKVDANNGNPIREQHVEATPTLLFQRVGDRRDVWHIGVLDPANLKRLLPLFAHASAR